MVLLRLIAVFFRSLGKRLDGPLAESVITLRVWPNDLDLNLHLNNGRFLTIMDLGRFDLMFRLGLVGVAFKNRWRPMLGAGTIRFRKPLAPFARYQLKTRLVCWDDKWLYFEQRFEKDGRIAAAALVRGLLRGPEGNVPTAELLAASGFQVDSPPIPEPVRAWLGWLESV